MSHLFPITDHHTRHDVYAVLVVLSVGTSGFPHIHSLTPDTVDEALGRYLCRL